ncbi:MAG TPA: DivIVA domain-containing protein [Acidimicrobiia bacterium]|nr:DivIVA domain-containing protein [Acidimicrobiia bacterium]
MASMDVTPQELRDIEIREAWRGYHRDDVDELLERAAATIEDLEAENHQLRARLSQAQASGSGPAPTRQPAPSPLARPAPAPARPAPAPAPAVAPVPTGDADIIQRTLLLAQKAADEAIADARRRAQEIVGSAEAKATKLVDEAESKAAEIAAAERKKLEEDIVRLQQARDTLNADVDTLERFEQEYRDRLRRAIEGELDLLAQATGVGQRPEMSAIDLPQSSAPSRPAPTRPAPVAPPAVEEEDSWSASQEGAVSVEGAASIDDQDPTQHVAPAPPADSWDTGPAGGWTDAPTASVVEDSGDVPVIDDVGDGASLDDDAFFASLREAVRDEGPLDRGGQSDDAAFFDQEDTDEHRGLFKRRR